MAWNSDVSPRTYTAEDTVQTFSGRFNLELPFVHNFGWIDLRHTKSFYAPLRSRVLLFIVYGRPDVGSVCPRALGERSLDYFLDTPMESNHNFVRKGGTNDESRCRGREKWYGSWSVNAGIVTPLVAFVSSQVKPSNFTRCSSKVGLLATATWIGNFSTMFWKVAFLPCLQTRGHLATALFHVLPTETQWIVRESYAWDGKTKKKLELIYELGTEKPSFLVKRKGK